MQGTLTEKEEDVERVARQATSYCIQDVELYQKWSNDVSLRCISREQGCEPLADIHGGDCGHHLSSRTLVGKAFHSEFYWPTALSDATEQIYYASVAHTGSNGQAERTNGKVLRGLKTRTFKKRLKACGRGWHDELQEGSSCLTLSLVRLARGLGRCVLVLG
ncbi:uncharacterized protein [Aegilops tauschii subsp. strangulata]|uniref:uncharacterized protein n=1 Tax=Aegilops tauschii subsp. strangulata TaxID=200361 RepID=UPI00098A0AEE|nr:uncharacterized protein LOC109758488 [Aegilops tauschii subsp. strangulata]